MASKAIPATIGPMESYCWYEPHSNMFKVRFRMEMSNGYHKYWESVIVSISPEALARTAEGMESVHCSDPDKIRWTRVSEAGIDEPK